MKIIIIFSLITHAMFALMAAPNVTKIIQPNKETFLGEVKGDQHFSWIETNDGRIAMLNTENNFYEYANIENNELITTGTKVMSTRYTSLSPNMKTLENDIDSKTKNKIYSIWKKKIEKNLNAEKEMKNKIKELLPNGSKDMKNLTPEQIQEIKKLSAQTR